MTRGAAAGLAVRTERLLHRLARMTLTLEQRLVRTQYRLDFARRTGDIFLIGYAEPATVAAQELLWAMLSPETSPTSHGIAVPSIERLMARRADVSRMAMPAVFASHAPHGELLATRVKYVYLYRGGVDVARSLFAVINDVAPGQDFSAFFHRFLDGEPGRFPTLGAPGSWFAHTSGWFENSRGVDVLYVRIEELVSTGTDCLGAVSRFCGRGEAPGLVSPDAMRRLQAALHDQLPAAFEHREEDAHFVRRGRSGGWRDWISGAMAAAYQAEYDRHLAGLGLPAYFRGDEHPGAHGARGRAEAIQATVDTSVSASGSR